MKVISSLVIIGGIFFWCYYYLKSRTVFKETTTSRKSVSLLRDLYLHDLLKEKK
jgi:Trk-type K+ transport system membrane component